MKLVDLPLALDVAGIVIASAALIPLRDVIRLVQTPSLRRAWCGLTALVLCCIVMLAASAVKLLAGVPDAGDLPSSVIHVLGPSFALGVALLTRATARDMGRVAALALEALNDPLTGLANRRRFDEVLDAAWRRAAREGEPMSLIMIDVDGLKRINDTRGHPAGDACLRTVARAIGGSLNRSDDLTARIGGDEFAVVLPGTDAVGAAGMAERIRLAIRNCQMPAAGGPENTTVTASFGIATTPGNGATIACGPATLVAEADARLYEAKRDGRDRIRGVGLDRSPASAMIEAQAARTCSAISRASPPLISGAPRASSPIPCDSTPSKVNRANIALIARLQLKWMFIGPRPSSQWNAHKCIEVGDEGCGLHGIPRLRRLDSRPRHGR